MTHWRKLRNEKYLGAWDLEKGKEYPFLIDKVQREDIKSPNGIDSRPVIYTKEGVKGVVINVENAKMIEILHGENIEDWVGKTVIIVVREINLKGGKVPALRILNKRI